MANHAWTKPELEELFYDALLRDHRSVGWTADRMRWVARNAAEGAMTMRQKSTGQIGSEAGCYG